MVGEPGRSPAALSVGDRRLTGVEDIGIDPTRDAADVSQPRPQSLLLAFFGNHVLEEGDLCVYSGSIIEVLGRVGVGEQAVRSTLTRMVNRGLLQRRREGRRMHFGLTEQAKQVLYDGGARIWKQGAVNDDWDGTWTLLAFSLPDAWKRQRHKLRSRLAWSGFGALYSGLWIAPGQVDVSVVVAELGLAKHVKVFHGEAGVATDIEEMIRDTWDLESVAARYRAFDSRWSDAPAAGPTTRSAPGCDWSASGSTSSAPIPGCRPGTSRATGRPAPPRRRSTASPNKPRRPRGKWPANCSRRRRCDDRITLRSS